MLVASLAFFSTGVFTADDTVIESFKSWHNADVDRKLISRPMPNLMELFPGMSSVTQVLPDKVRNYLLKRFRKSGLGAEEWARRWRLAEDRLLEGAEDAFDVIVVLEQLGQEAFEVRLAEEGLLSPEKNPTIKGAEASRYFLLKPGAQDERFEILKRDLLISVDPLLEKAIELVKRQGFGRNLDKEQKIKLAMFLLELHHGYEDYEDLGQIKESLSKMLDDERKDFEEEFGFPLPESDEVYAYLSKARWTFKKH